MTPALIIKQAAAEGVRLALTPTGTIKATGNEGAVNRWLPLIREHKPEIIEALHKAANDAAVGAGREVFEFGPPADPANDAAALQEARWQVHRE